MKKISRLQYITTSAILARQACEAGVDWIQLRLKNTTYEAYKAIALEVQEVCKQYNATFIINDNVSLALDIGASGVHIGKTDMPPAKARALLGNDFILGCTANTLEDMIALSQGPADYIGLGPYRFTTTKENLSPIIGLEGYRRLFEQLKEQNISVPPVVGIGGIQRADVVPLLNTGLHGIAVSGAISAAGSVTEAAAALVTVCREHINAYAVV